ncbi:MAG: glycerophosphodiester phosphodiesterase [Pseudomonadota bacterium]
MKQATKRLPLGGHRGLGCTDHDFYQNLRDVTRLPAENTLESVDAAFRAGADYIETDVMMSGDGVLFTLHNIVPKDHFFGNPIPSMPLSEMAFADIKKHKTGRCRKGTIARFDDMLELVARLDPHTLPWGVNIEIKGVQGSGQPYEQNDFLPRIAEAVKKSHLPSERILWSSFCMESLIRISHLFPQSSFGMLFGEKPEAEPIYKDHVGEPHYQYLPFDIKTVDFVRGEWEKHAHKDAVLGYVHPETMTISTAMIDAIAERGLGINSWGLFEKLDAERAAVYAKIFNHASGKEVKYTAITDYLPEMKKLNKISF